MDHTDSKFVQAGETPVLPANLYFCTLGKEGVIV